MKAARTGLVGERDEVARAGDVGELGLLGRCGEVVHGGEMEELGAAQLLAVVDREAKPGLGKVAG